MTAEDLFRIIVGRDVGGFLELRANRVDGGMFQRFFPVAALEDAAKYARGTGRATDLFVGAAPRTRREGGKGAVPRAWCLWVDCDTLNSAARLGDFPHEPTAVVWSGTTGHLHAWWALTHPLPARYLEQANRRLAHAFGADPKCAEAARIMRIPGTFNFKTDPANPVAGKSFDRRYDVGTLVADLADPVATPETRAPRARTGDALEDVSAEDYYTTLTGRELTRGNVQCPFHGDGHERNPSMRLYDTTWACFGCPPNGARAAGGTVYEFGAKLWGLGTRGEDFKELRRRLCAALGVTE